MKRRYTLTSTQFEGKLILEYQNEVLTGYVNEAELTENQAVFLSRNFPTMFPLLAKLVSSSHTLTIIETTVVPTFTAFWDGYAYKVGNKTKTEAAWNTLSNEEKMLAVSRIPAYDAYLRQHANMEKLYPSTYLHQKRFEADYKGLLK